MLLFHYYLSLSNETEIDQKQKTVFPTRFGSYWEFKDVQGFPLIKNVFDVFGVPSIPEALDSCVEILLFGIVRLDNLSRVLRELKGYEQIHVLPLYTVFDLYIFTLIEVNQASLSHPILTSCPTVFLILHCFVGLLKLSYEIGSVVSELLTHRKFQSSSVIFAN